MFENHAWRSDILRDKMQGHEMGMRLHGEYVLIPRQAITGKVKIYVPMWTDHSRK
jgi:hypothetical protein